MLNSNIFIKMSTDPTSTIYNHQDGDYYGICFHLIIEKLNDLRHILL